MKAFRVEVSVGYGQWEGLSRGRDNKAWSGVRQKSGAG